MQLENPLFIPPSHSINERLFIPGSKSISNRALLIAALAKGESTLENLLSAIDTRMMMGALKSLGCRFETKENAIVVSGLNGRFKASKEQIYIENAGTAARFLTVALFLGEGDYELTGNNRMQERPLFDLVDVLKTQNLTLEYNKKIGYLPMRITSQKLPGGLVNISGQLSSQYISALMIAAPYAQKDTTIIIKEPIVSLPYIDLTINIMKEFKAEVVRENNKITISNQQQYQAQNSTIESDASSASYFFAFAAITKSTIRVENISKSSTQGDIAFLTLLEKMGCRVVYHQSAITVIGGELKAITADMYDMSDVAPTLAAVAVFAKGKTIIKNVENMRIKECDRIAALVTELKKLNIDVHEFQDGLSIQGQSYQKSNAVFDTYDDHRMAMSLALLGLKIDGIKIKDPECVNKTFPDYFERLFSLYKTQSKEHQTC